MGETINKLILGTAQFGLNYGINNLNGKPRSQEVFEMLNYAHQAGVQYLDTAEAYGDATKIIGEFHKNNPQNIFELISKIKLAECNTKKIEQHLRSNIKELGVDRLWGYLFHSFQDYSTNTEIVEVLDHFKGIGLIQKLGVSIYTNQQFEIVLNDERIDLIQLPFNLFDNFNIRGALIKKAKAKGKIIHTRSAFLQGLFFKSPTRFPEKLMPLANPVRQLQELASISGTALSTVCINYAIKNPLIDGVIMGVDNIQQLKDNIQKINIDIDDLLFRKAEEIKIETTNLLNPTNWH